MIHKFIADGDWNKAIELSVGKVFYVVHRKTGGSGMFSNVAHVLEQAAVADKLSLIPIVDMKKYKTVYNERKNSVNGTFNAWEYYFEQLCDYSLEHVYRDSQFIIGNPSPNIKLMYPDMDIATERYKKFFKPKAYILELVDSFRRANFDSKKVLGVHWRGGEMKTQPGHHVPPSERDIINSIKSILDNYPVDNIFLVTEQQHYLDIIIKKFGNIVSYTDYFRVYEPDNAYKISPYPRELHMYKLGLEVIVDTLLLSHVDYLIAGGRDGVADGSNVSRTAQILNARKYKQVMTIYNGINPR